MKKNFKFYAIAWVLLLGLFNLVTFVVPAWPNLEKFTASFWIGWSVTLAAFFGQLALSWYAFKAENIKKTFYNVSLFTVSLSALVSVFVVSLICIVVTPLPYWTAAIACAVVLVVNVIAVLKATVVVSAVNGVDEKISAATSFIYNKREESESVLARATSEEAKAICVKVRDAFKYSDPMTSAELVSIESEIAEHFEIFKQAVKDAEIDKISSESSEILALVYERNNKCKRFK